MREGARQSGGPLLAILVNVRTPYRVHLHRRIAREIPEIRLASLFTHGQADQPWATGDTAEINPVDFGATDPVAWQGQPRHFPREWRKGGRIISWIRENRPAAVMVAGYNDPGRLRVIRWCRRAGVPCFLSGDSNIKGDVARGLTRVAKNILVSRVVGWCTGVMPCGSLGAAYFARYGARPERTVYYPVEPDYEQIAAVTPAAVAAALAKHGLDPARRRSVVCSRLIPHKRIDVAVDAFVSVAGERPEWDLVMIGDGPELAALKARIPAGLSGRVRWTGFIGDQAEISAIYRGSDVLVHPSGYEPWALVINEAAAAGMAIVSTDVVGASAELVREGVNGYLVPAGDVGAMAAAVRRATEPGRVEALKAASAGVLADWRERADPVEGVRKALRIAGVGLAQAPSGIASGTAASVS